MINLNSIDNSMKNQVQLNNNNYNLRRNIQPNKIINQRNFNDSKFSGRNNNNNLADYHCPECGEDINGKFKSSGESKDCFTCRHCGDYQSSKHYFKCKNCGGQFCTDCSKDKNVANYHCPECGDECLSS
jgi:predicted RNA-binding Zn-ribbon protein involved in translation (DUF1610 family)